MAAAFVDTSFLVATFVRTDQWHPAAIAVDLVGRHLLTTSSVVNETVTYLQRRGRFSSALDLLQGLRRRSDLEILVPTEVDQKLAWEEYPRMGAFGANAVDCLSFVVMRRRGVEVALTFDHHFEAAGFQVEPGRLH